MSAGNAKAAVRRLAACLVDIEARWRLVGSHWTPLKLRWCGWVRRSIAKVNVSEVQIALSRINFSETARDAWPRSRHRQSAGRRMSQRLLPATAATTISMSSEAVRMLVSRSFHVAWTTAIHSFYGLSDKPITRLQSVQNAAARPVSGAWRHDHITPVLHQLLTVSWSLIRVVASCVLPTPGRVSSGGPTATLETDVSRPNDYLRTE